MSDRAAPRDTQFDHQGEMVQQLIDWDRLDLYTAMPGNIESYNARTRRASVRPGLRTVYADGAEVDRPILHNVQVVWPRGRHSSLHFRLQQGDPVWLMFSMAGLLEWRQTHRLSTPDANGGHALKDAVALAGFGAVQEIEAIDDYDTWQSDDGERSVRMNESAVEVHNRDTRVEVQERRVEANVLNGTTTATLTDADATVETTAGNVGLTASGNIDLTATGNVNITAADVLHGGTSIGRTHTHSGVEPGAGRSGNPQ